MPRTSHSALGQSKLILAGGSQTCKPVLASLAAQPGLNCGLIVNWPGCQPEGVPLLPNSAYYPWCWRIRLSAPNTALKQDETCELDGFCMVCVCGVELDLVLNSATSKQVWPTLSRPSRPSSSPLPRANYPSMRSVAALHHCQTTWTERIPHHPSRVGQIKARHGSARAWFKTLREYFSHRTWQPLEEFTRCQEDLRSLREQIPESGRPSSIRCCCIKNAGCVQHNYPQVSPALDVKPCYHECKEQIQYPCLPGGFWTAACSLSPSTRTKRGKRTHICMHKHATHMRIITNMCIYIYMRINPYKYMHIYMCIYANSFMCTHTCAHAFTHAHTHTERDTRTSARAHTHIHIYIYMNESICICIPPPPPILATRTTRITRTNK